MPAAGGWVGRVMVAMKGVRMERRATERSGKMDATSAKRHRWEGCTTRRFRPTSHRVFSDRPREEQTWPTFTTPTTEAAVQTDPDAHPEWPGRRKPPVACYQRRIDRHTDGMVRGLGVRSSARTVTGRRRGMTTHRRPVAVLGTAQALGRGCESHYARVYSTGRSIEYRRFRSGGSIPFDIGAAMQGVLAGFATPNPRRAVIATIAVIVLVISTVGTGMAQQRYVAQAGDSIESIASTFGVDPEGIRRSSYLPTGDALQAGQVLVIPDPGQSPSEAALMAAELEGTSPWVATAHWVTYGETLSSIAALYGHGPDILADFNDIVDPSTIVPGQRILIPPVRDGSSTISHDAGAAVTVPGVVQYQQKRNLSCEYAAAHIATTMLGAPIEENVFIERVPLANNPHNGYRGNIDGLWGGTDDYGVYASALEPVIESYGFRAETFYSLGEAEALTARIDAGQPVLVWLGSWGDTRERLHDDGAYSVAAGMHVVTAYGYDDGGVYVSDPASASLDYYAWSEFLEMWHVLDGMGLAISW